MLWILIFAAALLLASYLCYRLAFVVPETDATPLEHSPKGEQYLPFREDTRRMVAEACALPFEPVTILSREGFPLYGRYYHTRDGAPLQIMFHGYKSAAELDFCGGLPYAVKLGFNVLLPDQRGHGKSGGRCLSFGVLERYDVQSWVNYACCRFGENTPITLYGISMGAATVLMAADLELPSNVNGIVSDCGYTTPPAIIKKVLRDVKLPRFPFYGLLWLGALLFGHFRLDAASAPAALASSKLPLLLIHGEEDRFVPCEMSRECYQASAAPDKTLLTVPGAGHGLSYMVDHQAYTQTLRAFLGRIGVLGEE